MQRRSSTSVVIKSIDREAVRKAVEAYAAELRASCPEVERVIWFGSWINGLPRPGSDVDLCLILSSAADQPRDRISRYLPKHSFPVGIDLFPYTRDEFERLGQDSPKWYATITSGLEFRLD
ncbi:MAG TPA: nucleotidyltransferase domain-containing protein [Acidobacteriota bacterium]|jgi:predicted nucleotidyltransferase